ncbi:hypothetical protein [Azospirillum isscasi]|uniref:Transposase n=1 Tax=Azospirillum isscasi TaxID=3053926 RepID=A0ABU0WET1_9PROT|nr:hypothetical protein [Azospirillum isscasi]MDQ2102109.1 hypothetical protein [Azospirillum isscasi]
MRLHEVMGLTHEEWSASLLEMDDSTTDAASRRAAELVKQGKLMKKRATVNKMRQQLAKKQKELADAQRGSKTG